MTEALIEVRSVGKRYGNGVEALVDSRDGFTPTSPPAWHPTSGRHTSR